MNNRLSWKQSLRRLLLKNFLRLPHSEYLFPLANITKCYLQQGGRAKDLFVSSMRYASVKSSSGTIQSEYRNGPIVLVSIEIGYTLPLSYAYLAGYLKEQQENVTIIFRGGDRNKLVSQMRKNQNISESLYKGIVRRVTQNYIRKIICWSREHLQNISERLKTVIR